MSMPLPYSADDLAVLVPTKDRPEKIRNLLDSLAAQSARPGRILIIDGGTSVRDVVVSYADRLPVEHHVCRPPGQIRQRNLGISLLDSRTPLVACFDDDIVLEPEAVAEMIRFWRHSDPQTAAVSFNIINTPPDRASLLQRLFLVTCASPGRVLRSGLPSSNCSVTSDVRVQWVCGGATVWRADVLTMHPHRELPGKWAIGEDIIYSYPLGKRMPLYVCASARVRHEHVFDHVRSQRYRFHGRTQTLWVLYFVQANADLSTAAFLWSLAGRLAGNLVVGMLPGRHHRLEFAVGQVEALLKAATARLHGQDVGAVIAAESGL
jgi:glycosyltransferase involved in cell wall biosynthesis